MADAKNEKDGQGFRPNPITAERFAREDILSDLGLLGQLAGDWSGEGFNLIARPDFHHKSDLYLQLNHTSDRIQVEPIPGSIPNRGFGQDDINLYGLTYLQKINDKTLRSGLHVEPGLWVTLPGPIPPGKLLSFPPDVAPDGAQLVARMGTIPHGNAVVIEGIAAPFSGEPVIKAGSAEYHGSLFPSFNTTPTGAPPTAPQLVINAAGSSERFTAAAIPALPPFPQYDLSVPVTPGVALPLTPVGAGNIIYNPPHKFNTRTNFDDPFTPLNNTVANQELVNDPIELLRHHNHHLKATGHTFHGGTVINISSQRTINFHKVKDTPSGAPLVVNVPNFGGSEPLVVANQTLSADTTFGVNSPGVAPAGPNPVYNGEPTIPNIQFLLGQFANVTPPGAPTSSRLQVANAQTALIYATFWITKVRHHNPDFEFVQLQYAQMVILNFPVFHLLNNPPNVYVNLAWPHVTVASLRKQGV